MEYNGLNVVEEDNKIIVENIKNFNPVHIFECGQCFRWIKQGDGSYTGVARHRAVNVKFSGDSLVVSGSNSQDFVDIWYEYFDLGRDYSQIKARLDKDEIMHKAINFGSGIRLLKQDTYEALVSFITSANNRIPMIMKTVAAMSRGYGNETELNGLKFYTFPHLEKLSELSESELEVCGGGFRCKYIIKSSQMIRNEVVSLKRLAHIDTLDARNELMKLPGVGPKVADCVLLYSGTKHDVFPTDVWVKRVMEELYFKREASFKEIQEFAWNHFGELSGFAQQYLFYYARENRIGAK